MRRMNKVLGRLMSVVLTLYLLVGIFGLATFVHRPEELLKGNIILADYKESILIRLVNIICRAFKLNVTVYNRIMYFNISNFTSLLQTNKR